MNTCDRLCMPDNDNIAPKAKHYIDCIVWDFLGLREEFQGTRRAVGPARFVGVTTTGQRRAGATPLARHGLLYRLRSVGDTTLILVLGIVLLGILGAVFGLW